MKKFIVVTLIVFIQTCLAHANDLLKLSPEQISAFAIETAPLKTNQRILSDAFPAKISVPNTSLVVISSPVNGIVESLLVTEGETVTADQPLAKIRSTHLLQLQTSYLKFHAHSQLQEKFFRRDRNLYAKGIIAERRLLESEASYKEAINSAIRDKQSLQLFGITQQEIDQLLNTQKLDSILTIRSPIAGVVLKQTVITGERLAASAPLYQIGDLEILWAEVHVPFGQLGSVVPGDKLMLNGYDIYAEIITVGRMVHDADQGVLVRAKITDHVEQLRPGEFVEARLVQNMANGVYQIPAAAVVHSNDKNYVFTQNAEGFSATRVNMITYNKDSVIIRTELSSGTRIAIRGAAALKAIWNGGETE